MCVYAVRAFFLSWPWNSWEGIYGRFTLGLSPAIRSCLAEGIYGSLPCSKVSAFSQIMEAPKKLPSASVESHMPLSYNNLYISPGFLSGSPHWQPGRPSLVCPSVVLCSLDCFRVCVWDGCRLSISFCAPAQQPVTPVLPSFSLKLFTMPGSFLLCTSLFVSLNIRPLPPTPYPHPPKKPTKKQTKKPQLEYLKKILSSRVYNSLAGPFNTLHGSVFSSPGSQWEAKGKGIIPGFWAVLTVPAYKVMSWGYRF